jgi:hypothetical protein
MRKTGHFDALSALPKHTMLRLIVIIFLGVFPLAFRSNPVIDYTYRMKVRN